MIFPREVNGEMTSLREGASLQNALEGKDYSFPNEVRSLRVVYTAPSAACRADIPSGGDDGAEYAGGGA